MAGEVNPNDGRTELYSHVAAIATEVCRAHGLNDALATAAGWLIATRFKEDFGGQQIYVPKEQLAALNTRNIAIYEEWRANVRPDLIAKRYNLTAQRVYSIVNEMRALPEHQMKGLFDDPES